MKPKYLYLLLCCVGAAAPYAAFLPWLLQDPSPGAFVRDMFANRIAAFFALDVLVSGVVLIVFLANERKRLPRVAAWAPVVALLAVGVSLALPLYLYRRETELEREAQGAARA